MRLTYKTEYALLALIYLARKSGANSVLAQEISEAQQIPKKFLQQIFSQLKQARYINAVRGKNGGYRLAKEPKDITVAEIVRLFDGPLASTSAVSKYFYAAAPIEREKKALELLREVREFTAKKLESTTLADLI